MWTLWSNVLLSIWLETIILMHEDFECPKVANDEGKRLEGPRSPNNFKRLQYLWKLIQKTTMSESQSAVTTVSWGLKEVSYQKNDDDHVKGSHDLITLRLFSRMGQGWSLTKYNLKDGHLVWQCNIFVPGNLTTYKHIKCRIVRFVPMRRIEHLW